MADNYIERHMAEYEEKKKAWEMSKSRFPKPIRKLPRPDDEAL